MKRQNIIILLMTLLLICIGLLSNAQSINADRPGIATGPNVLSLYKVQIETGSYYASSLDISYNNTLLRVGILENIELRVGSNYVNSMSVIGFQPLIVGLKIKLFDQDGIIPAISYMPILQLPIAKEEFNPHTVYPDHYFLFKNDITNKLSICYNLGWEYNGEDFIGMSGLSCNYEILKSFNIFIEGYNKLLHYGYDFGITKVINNNIQLDLSYISTNKSVNVGISYLFSKK